ncbi:MAG: hypothetical protein CFE21_09340 [Bacteroidetes bacterium B1(2017)]|nr:MAG: hypothetical protein CFE21_09340 [Bacteroidetes bacterium B1(2017)]
MTFKEDILERIHSDFGDSANQANTILLDALHTVDYLNTDRTIRCILFLTNGNIKDLRNYIEAAIIDPRDVILWAEYEGLKATENPKRVRDFNKTFDECLNDVEE